MNLLSNIGIRQDIEELSFSPIREIVRSAEDLKDVIPFWFGEPDVSTPEFIRDETKKSLDRGETFYAPNSGQRQLRETIADYMNGLYSSRISTEQITVSVSGMNAIMLSAQALVPYGSKVVVLLPSWPNIPAVQRIMGAKVEGVPIGMKDGKWSLDMDQVFDACDSKTTAIIINSPNNPSGWTMSNHEQKTLLEFARKKGIWIVSDEVYARISFNASHAPSFSEVIEKDDRVIIVNSLSKSWAMTGWRLGWITGPSEVMEGVKTCQASSASHVPTFLMGAAAVALDCEEERESFFESFAERRDVFHTLLQDIPGIVAPKPEGAFYILADITGTGMDDIEFATRALDEANVQLVPGSLMPGGEGLVRMSYGTNIDQIREGCKRLKNWLQGL